MASAALTALKDEIVAAQAVATPRLRGLEDLARVSLSEATLSFVNGVIGAYKRRMAYEAAALLALNALEDDGFPEVGKTTLPPSSFQDLREQAQDITAAIGEFEAELPASVMTVGLGSQAKKST